MKKLARLGILFLFLPQTHSRRRVLGTGLRKRSSVIWAICMGSSTKGHSRRRFLVNWLVESGVLLAGLLKDNFSVVVWLFDN